MISIFSTRSIRSTSLLFLAVSVLVACAGTLWKVTFGDSQYLASSSVIDAEGNTYVAGVLPESLFLAKFNSAGKKLWEQHFDNTDSDKQNIQYIDAPALTLGPDQALYLAYRVRDEFFSPLVLKYSTDGELAWHYRSNYSGWLTDIITDYQGQIYASGWHLSSDSGSLSAEPGLFSLSSDGDLLWETSDENVLFADSKLLANENGSGFFVVASEPNDDINWQVIHKNTAGVTLWSFQPFSDYLHAFILDLSQDADGNIFASGYVNNEDFDQWQLAVAKLDQLGNVLWRYVEDTEIDVTSAHLAYTIRTTVDAQNQLSILDFRGNVTQLSGAGTKLWRQPVAVSSANWAMASALSWEGDQLYATVSTVDGSSSSGEPTTSLVSIYDKEGTPINSVIFPDEQLIQTIPVAKKTLVSVGNGSDGVVLTKLRVK